MADTKPQNNVAVAQPKPEAACEHHDHKHDHKHRHIHAEGNPGFISELDIRIWLRDKDPSANLLIDDFEFSPEEIRTAMTLTIDAWNDTPPFLTTHSFDVNTFPFRSALLTGTCANLMFIAANRFRRNSLNYNIPGGAVADQEKAPAYDAAGQRLWTEFKDWVTRVKRAINMEQGFGVIDGGLGDYRRIYRM